MAKAKAKGSKESEADKGRSHAIAMKKLELVTSSMKYMFVGLTFVGCIYVGVALPIKYSAGQTTVIQFMVDWIQHLGIDRVLILVLAGGATGWGYLERTKRLRERSEKDSRIISLEEVIDKNRTSSGLLVDGREAPKRDEL